MSQQDVDIQLQVWKDLAISKQVLMGAATDALGLDAECSTAELKAALDSAITRARDADINIQETRNRADREIADALERAETADKARIEAESKVEAAESAQQQAERQLANGRAENAEALKKARADVADKQNKLKAISKALADTPENVVRKLKNLKKQKLDETKLRNQAESKLQATRKEKAKLETTIEQQKVVIDEAPGLIAQLRELHQLCEQAKSTVEALGGKKKDQIEVPELDVKLLETIEQALPQK